MKHTKKFFITLLLFFTLLSAIEKPLIQPTGSPVTPPTTEEPGGDDGTFG